MSDDPQASKETAPQTSPEIQTIDDLLKNFVRPERDDPELAEFWRWMDDPPVGKELL